MHRIEIYPVDSVIQPSKNQSLGGMKQKESKMSPNNTTQDSDVLRPLDQEPGYLTITPRRLFHKQDQFSLLTGRELLPSCLTNDLSS